MYNIVQKTANMDRIDICTDVYPRSALDFRDGNFSWEATSKYPVVRHENTYVEHTHTHTHARAHNSRQAIG